jgi:hypothetical protein
VRARVKGFTTFEIRAVSRRSFVSPCVICDLGLNVCIHSSLVFEDLVRIFGYPQQEFLANQDPSDPSFLNLIFWSCSQLFELKRMSLLSMHCMAYALGTLGELTCIRMEISILISYLSRLVMLLSHNQRCRDGT